MLTASQMTSYTGRQETSSDVAPSGVSAREIVSDLSAGQPTRVGSHLYLYTPVFKQHLFTVYRVKVLSPSQHKIILDTFISDNLSV